jgi:hypothetical protein
MRKLLAVLTVLAMLLSLTGCLGRGGEENTVIDINGTHTILYHPDELETHEVEFSDEYWSMPVAREDDGTFTKEGHVLLGYSFNEDASGELIRPGYRFELPDENTEQHLYCVWAKETAASDFETAPNGSSLKITTYKGSDKVVYIPRSIDGKTITAIADNAFANNSAIEEVHITSSIVEVAPKAFAACENLKTVTLYDSLHSITDAAFMGGTPIETVRLCAGKTPRYTNSFVTFGIKYERLLNTRGEKRLIFIAGSSVLYGVDTQYMESLFEDDITVVNFGTNGNQNTAYYLDAIAPYLTENDTVIFTPEQYGDQAYHVNGNPEMPSATIQGTSTCYNLFENINVANYTNIFTAIGEYCDQSIRMAELSWYDHSPRLDTLGDNASLTDKMNSADFVTGLNGTFRFNETVIPEEFIPNLNRVIDKAKDTGATVLFGYPPHNVNNIEAASQNDDAYDSYNKWISETIHCPLISDVRDYIYNAEVFDNTDYHVNTTGRKMHTENLVEDIKNANIGIK